MLNREDEKCGSLPAGAVAKVGRSLWWRYHWLRAQVWSAPGEAWVIAGWFAAEGRRGSAWFYGTAIPLVFMALAAVGLAVGVNPVAPAFLATSWIWVMALAVHLYRREATRRVDVPAAQEMRSAPAAG